ncbi:hypothetical protein D3C86_1358480 [compost metagenome]
MGNLRFDFEFGVGVLDAKTGQRLRVVTRNEHSAIVDSHPAIGPGGFIGRQHAADRQINILACGQNHRRINFQLNVRRPAGDDVHPNNLVTAGALREQRLVAGGNVGHGRKHAVLILECQFANPPAANVGRQHHFSNEHVRVYGGYTQLVELGAVSLIHQFGLRGAGHRVGTVGIPDQHVARFPRDAECIAVSFFCHALRRQHAAKNRVLINHGGTHPVRRGCKGSRRCSPGSSRRCPGCSRDTRRSHRRRKRRIQRKRRGWFQE